MESCVLLRLCALRCVWLWQFRRGLSRCFKLSYGLLGQLWFGLVGNGEVSLVEVGQVWKYNKITILARANPIPL